jgi:hypothetical protein
MFAAQIEFCTLLWLQVKGMREMLYPDLPTNTESRFAHTGRHRRRTRSRWDGCRRAGESLAGASPQENNVYFG